MFFSSREPWQVQCPRSLQQGSHMALLEMDCSSSLLGFLMSSSKFLSILFWTQHLTWLATSRKRGSRYLGYFFETLSHIASAALKLTVRQGYPWNDLPDPIFRALLSPECIPTPGREDAIAVPSLVYSFSVLKASVGDFCFSGYRLSLSEEKTVWRWMVVTAV